MRDLKYNKLLSGLTLSTKIREELRVDLKECLLRNSTVRPPCLTMVLVGDNYASKMYVDFKHKTCQQLGISSRLVSLDSSVSQEELLVVIDKLNQDDSVDGILVQLPLPDHIDKQVVLSRIDPRKDVDGLSPYNQGLLMAASSEAVVPCTPLGIVELIRQVEPNLEGKLVAVVGRSLLVGKSVRLLLENYNCTTIGIHSKTKNPQTLCQMADIVVVAVGHAGIIDKNWIKKDAIVIDVGINKDNSSHTVGDVNRDSVYEQTINLSPVPGGVGPMTITMLMKNTIKLWKKRFKIKTKYC